MAHHPFGQLTERFTSNFCCTAVTNEAIDSPTLEHTLTLDTRVRTRPRLDVPFDVRAAIAFCGVVALALFFVAYSIYRDVSDTGVETTTALPFVLLGVALFVALGFEFVNGFHDTANAVATVIYTHSMPA